MVATATDQEEQLYWLALHLIPGLGARRAFQLLERFDSPRAIFRAPAEELEGAGVSPGVAQSIASGCTFDDAVTQQQKLVSAGAEMISLADPRYPKRLRAIFDPPPLLFVRGRVELLTSLMLAVVGTRRPTAYGTAATEKLARDLAQTGLTIISGMARGIDTAAHKAALAVGGKTVAVFGCGVDQLYPVENRKLAEEIEIKGLLISEFAMGTPAYPQNFPIRNRVVSGLSIGVLVVEGAKYSGSAITARLAIEQGRELFAVPGNITNKASWGPNLLIKQGAKLVQEAEDVLSEMSPDDRRRLAAMRGDGESSSGSQASLNLGNDLEPIPPIQRDLLAKLPVDQATQIDTLLEYLPQYTSSELFAALFDLEMLGKIRQLAGKNYIKVW